MPEELGQGLLYICLLVISSLFKQKRVRRPQEAMMLCSFVPPCSNKQAPSWKRNVLGSVSAQYHMIARSSPRGCLSVLVSAEFNTRFYILVIHILLGIVSFMLKFANLSVVWHNICVKTDFWKRNLPNSAGGRASVMNCSHRRNKSNYRPV